MLSIEALQERIRQSELGQEWIDNSLLNQDVWLVEELGYSKQECDILKCINIHFEGFLLSWLKLLAKLTVLASIREKCNLANVKNKVSYLKQLDKFLIEEGYNQPELLLVSRSFRHRYGI